MSLRISGFEKRYPRAENVEVIIFFKNYAPSAHSDLIEYLGKSSEALEGSHFSAGYCFDFFYTSSAIIFAVAIGMRSAVFRLPHSIIDEAISSGGTKFNKIGACWVEFNPYALGLESTKHWFEVAYKHATSLHSS